MVSFFVTVSWNVVSALFGKCFSFQFLITKIIATTGV